MTMLLIVIGALSKLTKGLAQGLEDLEIGGRCWDQLEYCEESWRFEC